MVNELPRIFLRANSDTRMPENVAGYVTGMPPSLTPLRLISEFAKKVPKIQWATKIAISRILFEYKDEIISWLNKLDISVIPSIGTISFGSVQMPLTATNQMIDQDACIINDDMLKNSTGHYDCVNDFANEFVSKAIKSDEDLAKIKNKIFYSKALERFVTFDGAKWLDHSYEFVDWELKNWIGIYKHELESTLKLYYRDEIFILPQKIYFNNVDRDLENSQMTFKFTDRQDFELDQKISEFTYDFYNGLHTHLIKKRRHHDMCNLRLCGHEGKKGGVVFKVEGIKYDDYIRTNLILDAKDKHKRTLRSKEHPDHRLEELENSKFGNNLGINVLIFTSDNKLILQERSEKVAFRKGELCSSVSGTARKSDLQPATTMDALPLREIERELLINKSDLSRIQFLGITRELIRGGQPDMFFFAKLKKTYVDFYAEYEKKHSESKREIKKLNMFDFGEVLVSKESCNFRKKFNDLIDIHGNLSSIPLLTNLALWYQYCIKCKS